MKKFIVLVLVVGIVAQAMVMMGFVKPVFSFSYSYAADMIIVSLSVVAACFIYMIPTCIAASRQHRNTMAIAVLNLFFGGTMVGFVGCLAWSLINVSDKK
nr:MAG TPA: Superinfection immunity protein [Caudoviricetes sp.]